MHTSRKLMAILYVAQGEVKAPDTYKGAPEGAKVSNINQP